MEYNYKSYCELIVASDNITPDIITEELHMMPGRSFKKGDVFILKSGSQGIKKRNLWAIKSNTIFTEDEDISVHIQFFRKLFENNIGIFQTLKTEGNEICFWVWIEVNEIGIGLDIADSDLSFINSICNRLHITVLSNKDAFKNK